MKQVLPTAYIVFGISSLYSRSIITPKQDKITTRDNSVNGWVFSGFEDAEYTRDEIKKLFKEQFDPKSKKKIEPGRFTEIENTLDVLPVPKEQIETLQIESGKTKKSYSTINIKKEDHNHGRHYRRI